MFKNIRTKMVGLLGAATLLVVPLAVPALASAASASNNEIQTKLCSSATSLTVDSSQTCSSTSAGTQGIDSIIKTIIDIFSVIVGVVAVIMIIFGGFRYITSGGDSNNITSAKNTIIYAIIGLVIVALAQFIVQFVLNKVTQTT